MGHDSPLSGVICDDRADVRRTVSAVLARCGFAVAGDAEDFVSLSRIVGEHRPTVVVLALPVSGVSNLVAVTTLRTQAPDCEVVVLSAFEQLELAALEAGATALVAEDDPLALQAVLKDIAAGAAHRAPPAPRTPQASGPTTAPTTGPTSIVSA